jgi:CheY-like chemotaxis protein
MATNSILLVDDDEIIRSALRDLLSHKGFIVTVADSIVGALKLINCRRIDVLLTDLHVPGAGDGYSTAPSHQRCTSPNHERNDAQ